MLTVRVRKFLTDSVRPLSHQLLNHVHWSVTQPEQSGWHRSGPRLVYEVNYSTLRIFFNCKPVWLYYDRYSVQFHINIALTNIVLMHFRVSKKTFVVFQHKKCGFVELHVYC